ncbi:NUDIX hydrolase [Nocardiopsis terrae]|uniref:8-oxo-dGTP pyrophosphatase MutT (NUDIX family) n=1 Tax=Nocardiopsis terrae TaxID=372655 RepID=A0ABR9HNL3_9ACTN|nr:NUDIX domain-containing protein [Nocardiopsis terrae]MBE1460612.1 8-oxo-dGTP pyrophosphatase MutT (NUDIX family) [Nocardiopsis terrae]GHC72427.1 NUDIX hydrolase [Nocardiopsis terrae]
MSIPNSHVRTVLDRYLDRFPEETEGTRLLRQVLEADHELSSRKEFRTGHATAGAVVLDQHDRALLIHHNALRTWLLPGGHLEPEDNDLQEAALRELSEETSLPPDEVTAVDALVPLDLDIHRIPENPAKGEPEHWHFDFRYLYRASGGEVSLQAEEVSDHAWRSPAELPSERLTDKVSQYLAATRTN